MSVILDHLAHIVDYYLAPLYFGLSFLSYGTDRVLLTSFVEEKSADESGLTSKAVSNIFQRNTIFSGEPNNLFKFNRTKMLFGQPFAPIFVVARLESEIEIGVDV